MRKVKVKKIQKSVYNAPVKRLEQELAQLRLLIEHEQQQQQATRDAWLLLAEAILQHKVMFQLLLPLQRERLQSASGCDEPWLSAVNQFPIFGDWNRMLLLASATNPLMEATLTVTGDELKRLAYRTVEEICESLRAAVQKLVTLREMLSPERYPEPLVVCAGVQPPQAAAAGAEQGTDLGASACAVQYSLEPDLDKAATDVGGTSDPWLLTTTAPGSVAGNQELQALWQEQALWQDSLTESTSVVQLINPCAAKACIHHG